MSAVHGRKGGASEASTPVEAPDSIRSVARAKMLLALGEGEFAGGLDGERIFLDGTPLLSADGVENFPGVKWEFRPGTQHQEHIPGLPSVENEISVGVELRSDNAWTRAVTNLTLSAVRLRLSWPALQQQDESGNVTGYRIDYVIELSSDNGPWVQAQASTLNDKTTTKYERSHRIELPAATRGWSVRVRRLTANQNSNKIADTMRVEAITEVIDAKLRYPNTALLYIEFDASQFPNIPKISCKPRMRVIRVPSNYTPETRLYSGIWDGTFKWAWSDNPAWILYDIILSARFGMGRRLDASMVDRWELYQIAQYCDELVSDGNGGMEPRFICNVYIQDQADAWDVLRDIAAIFRGITYWSGREMIAQADMPSDVEFVFSRSNSKVVDGKITYSAQSERSRYTSVLVGYDNPQNGYENEPEPVSIPSLIRRYGFNQTQITAIGCTRQSEANRRGRWLLLTNSIDRSITFTTGLEGYLPKPGRLIGMADAFLAGRELAGRISGVAGRTVTLDRDAIVKVGDRLLVNLPSGTAEGRTVQVVAGRAVTVTTEFSETPRVQAQWGIDSAELAVQQYRVTSITRTDKGFEIAGVMNNPGKYSSVDSGTRLESKPISVIPARSQDAPANVHLSSFTRIEQGLAVTTLRASWDAAKGAIAYTAEWRKDSGEWVSVPRTSGLGFEVPGIYAGRYIARVRAINALDVASVPAYSEESQLNGKQGLPPAVTSLIATSLIFGIGLKWTFPPGAEDTQRTEIWYSPTNNIGGKTKLADLAYPQAEYALQSLLAGTTFFFWARLVDRSGNIGPFYPVLNGVMGQSSSDASPILDLIGGQVVESTLGKHLLDRIDLIDGNGPGSVNERLEELQADIGDLVDALVYVPTDAYVRDNTVRVGDNLWTAIANVPAAADGTNGPPNPTYWVNSGQSIRTANALAAQVTKNTTDIVTVDGKTTVTASLLQAVQASYRDDDDVQGLLADTLKAWDSTASAAEEVKVRTEQDFAQAQRTTTLDARVSTNEARVTTIETTTATDKQATAQQLTLLTASVNASQAAVQSEATARSNADGALSTKVDQVQAIANGASAAVQQTSSALSNTNGKLAAIWSVKMELTQNGTAYAAGFGLGLEGGASGTTSSFVIRADTFAVMNTSTQNPEAFFAITGGQSFIRAAFIQDGTITNAKIGSYISSVNYVAGQSGWILNKDGTLEINGVVPGQGRLVINAQNVSVYDVNNVLRVRLGYLG